MRKRAKRPASSSPQAAQPEPSEPPEPPRRQGFWQSRRAKLGAAIAALVLLNVGIATWTRARERALQATVPVLTEAPRPSKAAAQFPTREPGSLGFLGVVLNGDSANLEPKVEARILRVLVKPGDQVAQGSLIAQLDDGGRAQELRGAQAALRDASRRLARRIPLARAGATAAVTPEELDAARSQVAQERARVAALSAAVAETQLRAPFNGVVAEQLLNAGALSGPGRPVVRLASKGELRVRFAVPEEGTAAIALGVPLRIEGQSLPLHATGRVVGVNPQVDVSSRMVYALASVELRPDSQEPLTTGARVRVYAVPGPRVVSVGEAAAPPGALPEPATTPAMPAEADAVVPTRSTSPQRRIPARHRAPERSIARW